MVLATSLTLFGCFLFVCVYYWGSLTPNEINETIVAPEPVKQNDSTPLQKWGRVSYSNADASLEAAFTGDKKAHQLAVKKFKKALTSLNSRFNH